MSVVRILDVHGAQASSKLNNLDIIELCEAFFMALSTVFVFCYNYDNAGIGNALTNLSFWHFLLLSPWRVSRGADLTYRFPIYFLSPSLDFASHLSYGV